MIEPLPRFWSMSRRWPAPLLLALLLSLLPSFPLLADGPAGTATIRGVVLEAMSEEPLPGVVVVIPDSEFMAVTGPDGNFAIEGLPPGGYTLEARLSGYVIDRLEAVVVDAGETVEVECRLVEVLTPLEAVIVTPSHFGIMADDPQKAQSLDREDIELMPHLADDLFRVVSQLPGASGAGDMSAKFNIRGGEESEVLVLFDGLEIYEPFHLKDFQGVFSIIDSSVVGGVDLLTGGFPAEFGGRMSGVLDITSLTPEETVTAVGASFTSARFLTMGTFSEGRGSWLFNARKGYLDLLLDLMGEGDGEDDDGEFSLKPAYHDVYGKLQYQLNKKHVLSFNLLTSYDRTKFSEEELDDPEEIETADLRATYGNSYIWFKLDSAWSDRLFSRTVLSAGKVDRDRMSEGSEETPDSLQTHELDDIRDMDVFGLRQDWSWKLSERNLIKFGFDLKSLDASYDYDLLSVTRDPLFTGGETVTEHKQVDVSPSGEIWSLYLADRFRPLDRLTVEAGLRYDRETYGEDKGHLGPRLNVRYDIDDRSSVRAAWGHFYQSQAIYELQVEDGVDQFQPAQRAEHWLLGYDRELPAGFDLRVELYHKIISDPISRYENLFYNMRVVTEHYPDRVLVDPEEAEASGIELMLSRQHGERFNWWASYALARAEDRIDGEWVPRSWDQQHAVNLHASWRISPKWDLSCAWRYHSGWPRTDVLAVPGEGGEWELELGPRNGERYPAYHRLDARISRRVDLNRGGRLTLYFEAFNLYARKNVRNYEDFSLVENPDGTATVAYETERYLPFLPSFGFTWEF